MFTGWDIAIAIFVLVAAAGAGLYFLNRWASKRMVEQKALVERNKQTVSIYVIDKKRDRIQSTHFPKAIMEQMPRWNKLMKMYLVKAKVGPQITTLICEKAVFNSLPVKKTVKVDLSGIYISQIKGMKAPKEKKGQEAAQSLPWYRRLLKRR